ncbi:MAG: hypothetical protein ACREVZ_04715 [Burkholderiales bacterium]
MNRTKYFTDQVTGGSPGEASAEDMMRGYSDAGEPMPDDGMAAWFMPQDGGGGFVGRAKGWER